MPVLIHFSMPPIAFWQQSGRTCSLNIRILSLNFDYLLILGFSILKSKYQLMNKIIYTIIIVGYIIFAFYLVDIQIP